jgi:hypothetical protein
MQTNMKEKKSSLPFAVLSLTLVVALVVALVLSGGVHAAEPAEIKGSFLLDNRPVGKTPKYLGVCLEVGEHADRSNLWDWLADSGSKMTRVIHPDEDLRAPEGKGETKKYIQTLQQFNDFRARLLADPVRNLPWQNYRFDKPVPWIGVPDDQIRKATECGGAPLVSIGYGPQYYPRPLLKSYGDFFQAPDDAVNWDAAAAAYEYYLANIYRYASRNGTTHFMMLNEPVAKNKQFLQQVSVLARMARLALEDVRGKLVNKQVAADLRLSPPACHFPWEEFWPYVEPYCDFLDYHFYDPDPEMFKRQQSRMEMRARASGKKLAFTEFNRIGGPLQPNEALFSVKPSLQFAGLMMSILSASKAQDAGCEMALAYEFQSPATHRSFKSLVYGDMNLVDWTGQDNALNKKPKECYPSFEEFQLRMATPAYHAFKMLSRCTPGAGKLDSYEVLALGESAKGFSHVHDPNIGHNVFKMLSPEKYYSLNGSGPDLRTLAVRTPDRLIITVLNSGPTHAKRVKFDLEMLPEKYATAVVRETSLKLRDQAILQQLLSGPEMVVDLPAESMTQIIFTKEDLTKVTQLKLGEKTFTPGTAQKLGLLETTRLSALGKLGDGWLDLTDLNVVWTSSAPDLVAVYQGGLVQRMRQTKSEVRLTAKTLSGVAAPELIVPEAAE